MLKKNRLIFYSVFGVLHLFIFLFSLYMDGQKNNVQFLLDMQSRIWMLKYGSMVLLLLFATSIVLHVRDNRRHKKEHEDLLREVNVLKAKVYDYQESEKNRQSATK